MTSGSADDETRRPEEVLDSLPALVTTHLGDGEGTYTGAYTGEQVKDYKSPKQLVGESLPDVLEDEAARALLDTIETVIETGSREYVEFPVFFGGERYLRGAFVSPLVMPDTAPPGEVVVASFDLSRWDERYRLLYAVLDILASERSREDLERAFCDRLVERNRYEMAWIGDLDAEGRFQVHAASNADPYLSALRAQCGELSATGEPAVRALSERRPVVVDDLTAIDAAWATVAQDHTLQAGVALPLTHRGIDHGVLAVYTTDSEYLVSWRESVLRDYADAVSYGLSAGLWRWALATDTAATLTVSVPGGMALLDLRARAGVETFSVESVVPRAGETLYYLTDQETAPLVAAARASEGMRVYSNTPDGCAVVVESETPERQILERGAQFRRFEVGPRGATLIITVSRADDVRAISSSIQESYPDARLSVQWGEREQSGDTLAVDLRELLTDRQYEVLVAAHQHGYFKVERDHNASEIAELLDISRWTFSEHLRRAQGKLFDQLLGSES
jgi:DNA-binding CsgD family transcriptional regulator